MAKKPIDEIVSIEEKRNRRAELLQVSTAILSSLVSSYGKEDGFLNPENSWNAELVPIAILFAETLIIQVDENV